jgi:MoaA/NifB/PqqE/SkfB family radical SAM enzyme
VSPFFTDLVKAAIDNGIRNRPRPLILLLEPTERCNARCSFCYHWQEETGPELTLPEIERLLADAWELGCRFLYFSGGEPTIYRHTEGALAAARRQGYNISMTTNGSRLAARLPELAPYLDGVTVSLDWADERHDRERGIDGLYAAAVDGLVLARRYELPARINMNLHAANEAHVERLAALARDVGAGLHVRLLTRESRSLDIPAFDADQAAAAARRVLELKPRIGDVLLTPTVYFEYVANRRQFQCRPLSLLLTVDSSGRLFVPCPKWEGTKERIAGNIREAPLRRLWHSPDAESIRADAAACTPGVDCYTSCILDVSLLANLAGGMVLEQLVGHNALLRYFWRRT